MPTNGCFNTTNKHKFVAGYHLPALEDRIEAGTLSLLPLVKICVFSPTLDQVFTQLIIIISDSL